MIAIHKKIEQKNKLVLPVAYPPITSYTDPACLLTILLTDAATDGWFNNYFIQLIGNFENKGYVLHFNWKLMDDNYCPFLDSQFLDRDFIKKTWKSMPEMLISAIESDYYIEIDYNKYHLPGNDLYQTTNYNHKLLVYGYDKDKKEFNIAGFFTHFKYNFQTVSFDGLIEAVNGLDTSCDPDFNPSVRLMKLKKCDYTYDSVLFKRLMEDYVAGTDSVLRYEDHKEEIDKGGFFGITVYDKLIEFLDGLIDGVTGVDVRPFHILWDHKTGLLLKLEYLKNNQKFTGDYEGIKEKIEYIQKKCLNGRNLMIKYHMTLKPSLVKRMRDIAVELKEYEPAVLKELIAGLTF